MQPVDFACRVEREASTLTVRVTGEFDLVGVGPVEAALDPLPAGVDRVVMDLSGLSFLDASGLGTVIRAADRADAGEFELLVVRPRGAVNRVFKITRTDRRLTMLDSAPAKNAV
jgi:anti-anti-sigma factor